METDELVLLNSRLELERHASCRRASSSGPPP
jgi:hypothetical protein